MNPRGQWLGRCGRVLALACGFAALATVGEAADTRHAFNPPPLADRLTPEVMAAVYPGAERLGEVEGQPPSIAVYEGDEIVAFVFSTLDVVRAPGFSSYPFDIIAGVTPTGEITGAFVIDHDEPHIRSDRRREGQLAEFLSSHGGYSIEKGGNVGLIRPDFVAGATVSARSMRAAILDSARFVLRVRLGIEPVTEPTLDRDGFWPIPWQALFDNGDLAKLTLTGGEVAALLDENGLTGSTLPRNLAGPEDLYSEVYVGLGSVMAISRNVIAALFAQELIAGRPPGTEAILIGSNGRYDVFGQAYNRSAEGYRFDRFAVVQGDRSWTFTRDDYRRLGVNMIQGGRMQYAGLFLIPAGSGFDPLQPWRLDFFINGTSPTGAAFSLPVPIEYVLPESHVLMPPPPPVPAYVEAWTDARTDIAILVATLIVLTLIFIFQGTLARHRKVFNFVRTSFLLFTLVWLGWTAGGQLSTIHLINYATAPLHDFDVGFYLSEPLIVIIAGYTLVSLIVIGRGVFCGWLCPFGALQELLAKVARFFKLPQWNPSEAMQKRLWVGKYAAAVIVIGATFATPELASAAEEVEPFKTAITSMFARGWPFVLYAIGLLAFGLFTERAYCRFLCPLGGTLAALDRLHLVDVLKRRPECGTPCKLCEHSCPVKAIESSGRIKMAECFQCLDCQVEYYDDHRCPPLVKTRKQLARTLGTKGTPIRVPPPLVPVAARGFLA